MENTESPRSLIVNTRIASITPIESPIELKRRIPNNNLGLVVNTRQEISDIVHGQDKNRLLMVVGPCSILDPEEALEYAKKLANIRKQLGDEIVVVMRTYVEKPRTTNGWKGIAYAPNLNGPSKAGAGLEVSRRILVDVNNLGVPCGVETLDLLSPQYLDDSVAWTAVGARTTESQTHRQLISGVSSPVGFKNSTDGNIRIAVDAMEAAAASHLFYSINDYGQIAEVETLGNSDTHIVLRGSTKGTNYGEASVQEALGLISERGLLTESNRPIMIDCSHGNSEKDHTKQLSVAENVLEQFQSGQRRIMGVMVESNLEAGQQKFVAGKELKRGVSITDACIGWEETEKLFFYVARMIYPKRYVLA